MTAKMLRLMAAEMRTGAKRSRQETGLGEYLHLESVRVRFVSSGRLYHDHLETQVGRIAARQDVDLPVQMRSRSRTEWFGFPRIIMCDQ